MQKTLPETVISVLAGSHPDERVALVLSSHEGSESVIELRQQTWSDTIGWFTQSTVPLSAAQLSELRGILGSRPPAAPAKSQSPATWTPRVICAHSA